MERSTEDQLLARLKTGDSEAFGELYARYRTRVFRFAVKLLQNADTAEDIVQETFIRMRGAVGSLDQNSSLQAWLFTVARNEVYAHFRKQRSNGHSVDAEDVWMEGTPLSDVVGAETVEIVQRYIAQLKPEYREMILLREYEGLSYAEISVVTGDTQSSVKSRLHKARKALTEKLRPYFGNKE